ncbi:hypothetical protein StoSoilA2_31350 [Arthrobacter sp. StoSoilA2]|nr:hypothetical protein StoSoilA2_31350 [Arthrobacter sp. StoSoilA2]
MPVPDVIVEIHGVQGQDGVVHDGSPGEAAPEFRDCHPCRDAGWQAQDHVVEPASGEALRRRYDIQLDRTAEATVFQNGCFALKQLASPVDAPHDQGTIQEVVKNDDGVRVGSTKPGGGRFAALTVQGADNGEVHGRILIENHSH